MHVLTGLREEYNILKSTILGRQFPTAFSELNNLISDHDYMIKKPAPLSAHAFAATTTSTPPSPAATPSIPTETLTALQQLMSSIGLTVQPQSSQPLANYVSRGRGRNYSNRGRGGRNNFRSYNNGSNRGQFNWATTQNMIHGTCNRCGIGHIPSLCPNREIKTTYCQLC